MDCMWAQIKHLQSNGWTERQIKRPYLAFDGVLQDALQHSLPAIMPPSHHEDALYPLPRVVFRMFDYTDVPDVRYTLVYLTGLWVDDCLVYFINSVAKARGKKKRFTRRR